MFQPHRDQLYHHIVIPTILCLLMMVSSFFMINSLKKEYGGSVVEQGQIQKFLSEEGYKKIDLFFFFRFSYLILQRGGGGGGHTSILSGPPLAHQWHFAGGSILTPGDGVIFQGWSGPPVPHPLWIHACRVLDLRSKACCIETHQRHFVVSIGKTLYPLLSLVLQG